MIIIDVYVSVQNLSTQESLLNIKAALVIVIGTV